MVLQILLRNLQTIQLSPSIQHQLRITPWLQTIAKTAGAFLPVVYCAIPGPQQISLLNEQDFNFVRIHIRHHHSPAVKSQKAIRLSISNMKELDGNRTFTWSTVSWLSWQQVIYGLGLSFWDIPHPTPPYIDFLIEDTHMKLAPLIHFPFSPFLKSASSSLLLSSDLVDAP